jgi:outer membrane protein OmpA-like peptidoglycan-associated protein
MKIKWMFVSLVAVFLMAACSPPSHMGVPDRAMMAPPELAQTEAAIAAAEKSPGAKVCPDKLAKAKELAKQGIETYWACRTDEAMRMMADARKLAQEVMSCQPPPPPPPPPPPARQPISFHSVYFDFDKSTLKPEAKTELDRAAKIMQDNPGVVLELQGNTDAMGTDTYNKALGDRRAKVVFDYLKVKGIAANRLKTVSFGEAKPAASNETEQGRAKNRRVDLTILK